MPSAFALAARERKPLFLYWGAAWCPPCQYLERTVFRRREFIERSRRFVSVYLDGDMEGAQRLGEELGVRGYPTVLLFSPEGEEITRIPNLPIAEFVRVLDESLARMRPIAGLLGDVLEAEPAEIAPRDLHALAFYAWEEDRKLELSDEEWLEIFRALHGKTPADLPVERSRFLVAYLSRLAGAETEEREEEEGGRPSALEPVPDAVEDGRPALAEEAGALRAELAAVLGDPRLVAANLHALSDSSSRYVRLLYPEPSPGRDSLIDRWTGAMRAAADDPSLPTEDRLDALFPVLELYRLRHAAGVGEEGVAALPDSLVEEIRDRIESAVEAVTDRAQRHSVWNRINALSRRAGLAAEAEALLASTLEEMVAPHYYMWLLAAHARRAGRAEDAIEWRRRAYEAATGPATRFESGRYYLSDLMELASSETGRIEAESRRILGELLSSEDAFANRNREGLERLAESYRGWNEDGEHDEEIGRIRAFVLGACPRFPDGDGDSPRARCERFLAAEE